jgi:hypothetical protein
MVPVLPQGIDQGIQEMPTHLRVVEKVRQDPLVEKELDALLTHFEVDGVQAKSDASEGLVERRGGGEGEGERVQLTTWRRLRLWGGDERIGDEVGIAARQHHPKRLKNDE